MTDVSSVGAAVAAGLLSGGGAGYLVSIYTARKESEDRKEALKLERDKFDHELSKYERQVAENDKSVRARRFSCLHRAEDNLNNLERYVGELFYVIKPEDTQDERKAKARPMALWLRDNNDTVYMRDLHIYGYEESARLYGMALVHFTWLSITLALQDEAVMEDETDERKSKFYSDVTAARAQLVKDLEALEAGKGPESTS